VLRPEQHAAVEQALAAFHDGRSEVLWNAKPRFGKTLTTYDLMRRLDVRKVLIVTNRPAIANSWYDDFVKLHRPPDHVQVRLGVPVVGRPQSPCRASSGGRCCHEPRTS
jgi:superfamily II DNA or RNA helicase